MVRPPAHRGTPSAAPAVAAVLLLALASSTSAAGELYPISLGRPALRVFSDRHGLPQNTVHAITFDAYGRLWVGTQDGAAVSNGRGWQVVNMPSRMASNFVRAILAASDGSLWFATHAGGVHRLVDDRWEDVTPPCPDVVETRINALLETLEPPAIWMATHNCGVARRAAGAWEFYGRARGLPSDTVWSLHAESADAHGRVGVWAGTEAGAAVLAAGSSRFSQETRIPSVSVNSFLERATPDGAELWVGTYGAGLFRRRAGVWTALTERDGLPSKFVTSLASHGKSGPLWVGTDGGGLAAVTEDGIEVLDSSSGLPSDAVYTLRASNPQQGPTTLWIGTRAGGLARLMLGRWRSFFPTVEGRSFPVLAVLAEPQAGDSDGVWLGTDGGGLARLHRGGWEHVVAQPGGLPSNAVQCLLATGGEGGEATLWVGTRHGGLARRNGGRWTVIDQKSGALPSDMVQALAAMPGDDGEPELWVGTRAGLAVFRRGRWQPPPEGLQLPHPSVQVLLASRQASGASTMWIGTAGGVVSYSAGVAAPLEVPLRNRSVQALQVVNAPQGRRELWIGTDGGGVSRVDLSENPQDLPPLSDESDPPLPNNVVYQILQDREGRVWLLTNRGVARLSWRRDGTREFDLTTFTVDDGLAANQGNRGAGVIDAAGRVWVGTVGGVSVFDPATEEADLGSRPLLLKASLAGRPPHVVRNGERVPSRRSQLVFDFALLSHFREEDSRYRTQLYPPDGEPSDWSADVNREVGPLAPGAYTFRVWGRDWAGNVTGPNEFSFQVVPPPWRTWWAMVTYLLLAVGGVVGVMAMRARAHRRREEALRNLVAARTRELVDANQVLSELSYLDPLTAIGNRRRFDERLDHEWRRAVRAGSALSLIMIDIDYFKELNDTFGHHQGDECLRAIGAALADGLPRAGDWVARYGGEEFAVILPATERTGAVKLAEALRRRVEDLGIPHPASRAAAVVTISCGVATVWPTLEVEPEELIRLADESLYVAKHTGRNRTVAEHGAPRSSSQSTAAVRPTPPA